MTTATLSYLSDLESITEKISANAAEVDSSAQFPSSNIDALREANLLGLLISADLGGRGEGIPAASRVVERIARECGSTAMVTMMHYCGSMVVEQHGAEDVRRSIAGGKHFTTLAFSEATSRSQFWAPTSTARQDNGKVVLDAKKSWVTSAANADSYVWSSRPLAGDGPSTIWLVPAKTPGLQIAGRFNGLGLRGNDSTPVAAEAAAIDPANQLGNDGEGFGVMMETVLPIFTILNASVSIGLMRGALQRTIAHATATRFEHTGERIADQAVSRGHIARMQIETDMAGALLEDTYAALADGRPDAMLRVLEIKAAASERALSVLGTAMRVCGGSAFRKDVGVERYFRDGQAATVMAPTSDALHDFIGKAVCGLPLF